MSSIYYLLLLIFLILAVFLVLLVLIQKGRGGGLSAAFGGVGGNTAFGAKTGDVLTWATSTIFGVFLLLAIGLNLIANKVHREATALEAPAAALPTTMPTDAAAAVPSGPIMAPPTDPTPTPPPTPTTNPSTKPTAIGPTAATLTPSTQPAR